MENDEVKTEKRQTKEPEGQLGFEMMENSALIDELKAVDPTTLTPIEAMNRLYDLWEKAEKMN